MFIPCTEKQGTAYFEFQYCKKNWPINKLVRKGYDFWECNSILVHMDDEEEFFQNYLKYLEYPSGTSEFCYFGVNYYTKEQSILILEKIKEEKPKNFEILIPWLEKAITDYNGFFFLGI